MKPGENLYRIRYGVVCFLITGVQLVNFMPLVGHTFKYADAMITPPLQQPGFRELGAGDRSGGSQSTSSPANINVGVNPGITTSTPEVTSNSTEKTFTSSGSFTVPAGVTTISVDISGGGGGGGYGGDGTGGSGGGGGGGAAAFSARKFTVTPGASYTVTIGARGVGASGANSCWPNCIDGTAGGSSSFGSLLTTAGGGGGAGAINDGTGGSAGGEGGDAGSNHGVGRGGTGGNSLFGAGGARGYSSFIAGDGSGYGGGGGGGAGNGNNPGNGAPGFVHVRWTVLSSTTEQENTGGQSTSAHTNLNSTTTEPTLSLNPNLEPYTEPLQEVFQVVQGVTSVISIVGSVLLPVLAPFLAPVGIVVGWVQVIMSMFSSDTARRHASSQQDQWWSAQAAATDAHEQISTRETPETLLQLLRVLENSRFPEAGHGPGNVKMSLMMKNGQIKQLTAVSFNDVVASLRDGGRIFAGITSPNDSISIGDPTDIGRHTAQQYILIDDIQKAGGPYTPQAIPLVRILQDRINASAVSNANRRGLTGLYGPVTAEGQVWIGTGPGDRESGLNYDLGPDTVPNYGETWTANPASQVLDLSEKGFVVQTGPDIVNWTSARDFSVSPGPSVPVPKTSTVAGMAQLRQLLEAGGHLKVKDTARSSPGIGISGGTMTYTDIYLSNMADQRVHDLFRIQTLGFTSIAAQRIFAPILERKTDREDREIRAEKARQDAEAAARDAAANQFPTE